MGNVRMKKDKILGCLYGTALGDALGAPTEFLNMKGIREQFPPNGPIAPLENPALVTDDTQMALAVGKALVAAPFPYQADSLGSAIRQAYIDWYHDPQNNRAPGVTCLDSCENLIDGMDWIEATNISSKGCGANMRVQPVGCLAIDASTRAGIAQLQAAYTHGHATGLAAADLTAYVIHYLGTDGKPENLAHNVRQYAESQKTIYHQAWLGDLYLRAYMFPTPEAYIEHGWTECLGILDRLGNALLKMDANSDPCEIMGAGWIAEEAFGTALYCFLLYPDDPARVIQRAAFSSGDSDSIACIAGAFAGAYHGIDGWDTNWVRRIEYHDDIRELGDKLDAINSRNLVS